MSCVNCQVPHTPKPGQLSQIPSWQAIGGETSTIGTDIWSIKKWKIANAQKYGQVYQKHLTSIIIRSDCNRYIISNTHICNTDLLTIMRLFWKKATTGFLAVHGVRWRVMAVRCRWMSTHVRPVPTPITQAHGGTDAAECSSTTARAALHITFP